MLQTAHHKGDALEMSLVISYRGVGLNHSRSTFAENLREKFGWQNRGFQGMIVFSKICFVRCDVAFSFD